MPLRPLRFVFLRHLALVLGVGVLGCETPPGMLPSGQPIGTSFANAPLLTLDAAGKASFSSTITGGKVDVVDLGAVAPGDRIIVTVQPTMGSVLDPVAALFDVNEQLFALNDDVDFLGGRTDSAIDEVVKDGSPRMFFAVSKFPLGNAEGAYQATVEIQRGQPIPAPTAQKLLLNFAGGTVTIPSEGTINVGPFDAANIDAAYAGQTDLIKATIVNTVRDRFTGTGLQIVTSDDVPSPDPAECFSTMFFGEFSQTKFGVSQSVDQSNRDRCDDGIVFTDAFDKPFAQQPSVEGIGIAIGNVAAHEAGHLLGLNHVADVIDLMDTTGTASTLLARQIFKTSRLAGSIFPIGSQNGPLMLSRVIPAP